MKNILKSVEKFHTTFGHPVAEKPCNVSAELVALRHRLMEEENELLEFLNIIDICLPGIWGEDFTVNYQKNKLDTVKYKFHLERK